MEDEAVEPKARKACINCRKQKMKCRIESNNTCRRCQRAGLPCIFVPRANASAPLVPASMPTGEVSAQLTRDMLRRLKVIEEHLGLPAAGYGESEPMSVGTVESLDEDDPLNHLWKAAASIERCSPTGQDSQLWRRSTVKELWQSFHDKMPGLHFLPSKTRFSTPQPLLLAAMLYFSSVRGPADHAHMAPRYFVALCNAIAQLSVPGSEVGSPEDPALAEEWAFQTVLGLVLAGLLNEANVRETGIWISVAYRLIVEHCPPPVDERCRDWQRLFKGLQIVDLEHASLHLLSPVIPIEAPLAALQISHRDQLYRLSRMMHTGLSHFSGRGLPSIYACFAGNPTSAIINPYPFTNVDAAVIRDWARHLDHWLSEFTKGGVDTDKERTVVFRQYVLHRLVVLSIYHPARGCNLLSNGITLNEQHELLLSARATLSLHINDKSIWSNWDLVIITWAALIVIEGIAVGYGQPEDLQNIRVHVAMLVDTHEPRPSLRHKLASRLEHTLEGIQTPSPSGMNADLGIGGMNPDLDYSWQIFDQAIMEQMMDPFWPKPAEMPPM